MREFQITATTLSHISVNFFYADLCFIIPAGILLDRFSTKTIITFAMLICVSSTFVFAFSTNITIAMASRFK